MASPRPIHLCIPSDQGDIVVQRLLSLMARRIAATTSIHLKFHQCSNSCFLNDEFRSLLKHPFLTQRLQHIQFTSCPKLTCIPTDVLDAWSSSSNCKLQSLTIGECPNLQWGGDNIFNKDVDHNGKELRLLIIWGCGPNVVRSTLTWMFCSGTGTSADNGHLSKLEALHLQQNNLDSEDVRWIFNVLGLSSPSNGTKILKSIRKIDLWNNNIESLRGLVEPLYERKCKNATATSPMDGLEQLILSENPIMKTLCRARKCNERVHVVHLLEIAPRLHHFGYDLYGKKVKHTKFKNLVQHMMNVNRTGGRILFLRPGGVEEDITTTNSNNNDLNHSNDDGQHHNNDHNNNNYHLGLWPYVLERSASPKSDPITGQKFRKGKVPSSKRNMDGIFSLLRYEMPNLT